MMFRTFPDITEQHVPMDATPDMDQPTDPATSPTRTTRFRFKGFRRPDVQEREPRRRRRSSIRRDTDPFFNDPEFIAHAAFCESLFDARADAEGAAYWERIYGQPIHIYDRPTRYNPVTSTHEPVTDDEFAAYVRQKMWEHTWAGRLEDMRQRKKRHEAFAKEIRERRARRQRAAAEEASLKREMEEALRRGEARRRQKTYEDNFVRYSAAWETWDGTQNKIPWPTGCGTRQDVTEKTVRSFFTNGLGANGLGPDEFAARLKEQRVRWHPDKMQHKLGGKDQVTEGVMADITMIFQVIDTLYNDFLQASNRE